MLAFKRFDVFRDIVKYIVIGGTIVGVTYFGIAVPVQSAAGKQTDLNIAYQFIEYAKVHFILPTIAAGATGIGWWRERKGRLKERTLAGKQISLLESQLDPKRLSSGLNPAGYVTEGKSS